MIRKLIVWALGLSIQLLNVQDGDTLIFEARDDIPYENIEWYAATLKKTFKKNLIILQGISLKQITRKEK